MLLSVRFFVEIHYIESYSVKSSYILLEVQRSITSMEEKNKENRQRLMDAFASEDFQKEIYQYRSDIELELTKFLEWMQEELKP